MRDPSRVRSKGARLRQALVSRQLEHYPATGPRFFYLGLVVLTTTVLYYLYYVEGSVTPLLLPYFHMSFLYFLYLLVVSNALGAFSAFIGGLSDRIGRANLTIYGTLLVGLIQLLVIPNVHSKLAFAMAYCVVGFVEGIILVSTPALIRDFSPQVGRASAMGFWALGPVIGSLTASTVANHTLNHLHPWQDQIIISGFVALGVVLLSLIGLRELAPQLRDQLMVTERERALVEARAMGLDVEAALAHPWRAMFKLDLVSSSVAIALFLLIYYASVSLLTIYWVVVFNRSASDANGINTWYWAAVALALIVTGAVSDRLRVRKPFMVAGACGTIAFTAVLIAQTGHRALTYHDNVLVMVLLGVFIGVTYTPWMAGYTESVEAHNPALTATGLAVCSWILRIVVALSFVVLTHVITTATTVVDNYSAGSELQVLEALQPYVPSLVPGTEPRSPVPAPLMAQLAGVITSAPSADRPGLEAVASVVRSTARLHPSTIGILQALQAAQPYVPSISPSGPVPPPAPAGVLRVLRDSPHDATIALADFLQSYAISHNVLTAAGSVPLSVGGPSEILTLESFQPLATRVEAGRAVPPSAVAALHDPNLQQVLRDEMLLVPTGSEVPALLRFQPLAAALEHGHKLSDAQISTVGAADLQRLLRSATVLVPAQAASVDEWRRWWWICLAGQIVFLPLVFLMRGRWSPVAASRDLEAHERLVAEEMANLIPTGADTRA